MTTMIPVKKLSRVLPVIVSVLILFVFLQSRSYYTNVTTVNMSSKGLNNKARSLLLNNIVKAHIQHYYDWKKESNFSERGTIRSYDSYKATQSRHDDSIEEQNSKDTELKPTNLEIPQINTKKKNRESKAYNQEQGFDENERIEDEVKENTIYENGAINGWINDHENMSITTTRQVPSHDSLNIVETTRKQHQGNEMKTDDTKNPITDDEVHEKFRRLKLFILFIGYSRSGSSLTATILDAHKHVVISHEVDVLRGFESYNITNYTSNNIYNVLFDTSRHQSKNYRAKNGHFGIFNYYIPNTYQGTYEDYIQVIGDKEAQQTTNALTVYPRATGFDKLKSTLKIPIKFIHVVRNPFDIIATRVLIRAGHRLKKDDISELLKIDNEALVRSESYIVLNVIDQNIKLKEEFGNKVLDVNYSLLLKNPRKTLMKMCNFLEIICDEQYLSVCEEKLYANETYTRQYIVWPDEIKQSISNKIRNTDFLQDFQFEI